MTDLVICEKQDLIDINLWDSDVVSSESHRNCITVGVDG